MAPKRPVLWCQLTVNRWDPYQTSLTRCFHYRDRTVWSNILGAPSSQSLFELFIVFEDEFLSLPQAIVFLCASLQFSFLILHTVCGSHITYISDVLGERHGWYPAKFSRSNMSLGQILQRFSLRPLQAIKNLELAGEISSGSPGEQGESVHWIPHCIDLQYIPQWFI